MCVLSIKVAIRKKSGNLLYAPRKYGQIICIKNNYFKLLLFVNNFL